MLKVNSPCTNHLQGQGNYDTLKRLQNDCKCPHPPGNLRNFGKKVLHPKSEVRFTYSQSPCRDYGKSCLVEKLGSLFSLKRDPCISSMRAKAALSAAYVRFPMFPFTPNHQTSTSICQKSLSIHWVLVSLIFASACFRLRGHKLRSQCLFSQCSFDEQKWMSGRGVPGHISLYSSIAWWEHGILLS